MIAPAHAFLYVLGRDIMRGAAAAGSANDISAALTGRVKHDYDEAIARYQELGITDPHAFAARIQELGATPGIAVFAMIQPGGDLDDAFVEIAHERNIGQPQGFQGVVALKIRAGVKFSHGLEKRRGRGEGAGREEQGQHGDGDQSGHGVGRRQSARMGDAARYMGAHAARNCRANPANPANGHHRLG